MLNLPTSQMNFIQILQCVGNITYIQITSQTQLTNIDGFYYFSTNNSNQYNNTQIYIQNVLDLNASFGLFYEYQSMQNIQVTGSNQLNFNGKYFSVLGNNFKLSQLQCISVNFSNISMSNTSQFSFIQYQICSSCNITNSQFSLIESTDSKGMYQGLTSQTLSNLKMIIISNISITGQIFANSTECSIFIHSSCNNTINIQNFSCNISNYNVMDNSSNFIDISVNDGISINESLIIIGSSQHASNVFTLHYNTSFGGYFENSLFHLFNSQFLIYQDFCQTGKQSGLAQIGIIVNLYLNDLGSSLIGLNLIKTNLSIISQIFENFTNSLYHQCGTFTTVYASTVSINFDQSIINLHQKEQNLLNYYYLGLTITSEASTLQFISSSFYTHFLCNNESEAALIVFYSGQFVPGILSTNCQYSCNISGGICGVYGMLDGLQIIMFTNIFENISLVGSKQSGLFSEITQSGSLAVEIKDCAISKCSLISTTAGCVTILQKCNAVAIFNVNITTQITSTSSNEICGFAVAYIQQSAKTQFANMTILKSAMECNVPGTYGGVVGLFQQSYQLQINNISITQTNVTGLAASNFGYVVGNLYGSAQIDNVSVNISGGSGACIVGLYNVNVTFTNVTGCSQQ